MARTKTRKPVADRLAAERRRRDQGAARVAQQHAEQLDRARLDDIRRRLREAAEAHAAERLLAEAMAPTHPYGWVPWGYELQPVTAAVDLPVIAEAARPAVPQLRLVHSRPGSRRARARWDRTDSALERALAVMAA